jgi:hypothetical protein
VVARIAFRIAKSNRQFLVGIAGVFSKKGGDIHNFIATHEAGQADKGLTLGVSSIHNQKKNHDDPEKEPQHYFDVIF